jgi:hypothetical protein
MASLYSTDVLMSVVNSLVGKPRFFLDKYFNVEQTEESEEIHFDVVDKTRRLAPFVSPVTQGKIVKEQGFTTKTFKPAYIKVKNPFDANRPTQRVAGERIGGEYSAQDRMGQILAKTLLDHIEMIDLRLEVMSAEVLRTGALTITGEDYPTVNLNFGRDATLSTTLTGVNRWSDATSKPLTNLSNWSLLMLKKSGVIATDVVMDIDSWLAFEKNSEVQTYLDRFRGTSAIVEDATFVEGATRMATIKNFNIYVYAGWYLDPADNIEKPIVPSGTVMMLSPQIMGVRAFGAIKDASAGFRAMPYFSKAWEEEDPSSIILLTQSAPLIVPTRVNASFAATVL